MGSLTETNFTKSECGKYLVDSCILIYMLDNKEVYKHKQAMQWFASCKERIFLSAQNLREFASNCLLLRAPTEDIINLIELFSSKFLVLQDDFLDTKNAVEMSKHNPRLFWDASIVSVMKRNGIECIYTENTKDFELLGVKAINPLK